MRLDVKCLVWYVGHAGQRLIIIIINYLIMVIQFLPLLSRWWVESTYVLWNSKLCSLLIIWRGSLNYFPKGNSLAFFFFLAVYIIAMYKVKEEEKLSSGHLQKSFLLNIMYALSPSMMQVDATSLDTVLSWPVTRLRQPWAPLYPLLPALPLSLDALESMFGK